MNGWRTVLEIRRRGCSSSMTPSKKRYVTDDFQYYCIKLYVLEIRLQNTLRHLLKYFKDLNNSEDWVLFPRSSGRNVAYSNQLSCFQMKHENFHRGSSQLFKLFFFRRKHKTPCWKDNLSILRTKTFTKGRPFSSLIRVLPFRYITLRPVNLNQ